MRENLTLDEDDVMGECPFTDIQCCFIPGKSLGESVAICNLCLMGEMISELREFQIKK